MKQVLPRIVAIAVVSLFTFQLSAQNPNNPIQIALLRWYQLDTATLVPMQSTCISPEGVVFDGSHIWVSCYSSNELEEYNAADTAFIRKVSLTYGPGYLLYDGANIWATNPAAGKITEVQASSGTVLGTVNVGTSPTAMTFDGQYIWVTNNGSNTVSQVNALTRTVTSTINVAASPYSCSGPTSIIFISSTTLAYNNLSTSIWLTCENAPPKVEELTSTGAYVAATAPSAIGGSPGSNNVAFDGRYVWLPTHSGPTRALNGVVQIDTTTLNVSAVALPANSQPNAVSFDGQYIWVGAQSGYVGKIVASTGTLTIYAPSGAGPVSFLAFDGGYVWAATPNSNLGVYTVSKM